MTNVLAPANGAVVKAETLIALKAFAPKIMQTKPQRVGSMAGQYLSRSRGRGLEFAEVRHYQAGDDVRSIDWRITARSGKPHTRLYVEERERPVLIFCDLRYTMQFGTKLRFKSVQAANLASLLAWANLAKGDRVGGIIAANDGHLEIRPSLSHKTVSQFLGLVANKSGLKPSEVHTSTQLLLNEIRRVAKPGTSIYLISDFYDWNEECKKQLALIVKHNNLNIIMVSDPFEQHLPKQGAYPINDGKQQVTLYGATHGKEITKQFNRRVEKLKQDCQQYRIPFLHVNTNDDPVDIVRTQFGGTSSARR